jgi:RNA-binding protein with serine-rich domain 1
VSRSPRRRGSDVSMSPPPKNGRVASPSPDGKSWRVIVVSGLTRNVHKVHLQEIFGTYGKVTGVDLPVFRQCE